jgi:hypothetical protein
MAVLHPHYITAGRYTSKIDRKLLAGIFETDSTGKILTGVLPPEDHFFVSGSGLTVSVSPGFAVIADSASQSSVSPGAYFCTIDASSETLTLASSPDGFCQIYAQVNETQVDVTYKSSTGGIATLTTATEHNFLVGQTVLISGVDGSTGTTFDGSYVLTSGTAGTTIKYEKSGSVSNTAVSPVGKASVPFAIKATAAGGNIPSGNVIELASVKVASGSISAVIDKRTYVAARGAVQLYRGTAVNADGAATGVGNTATTPSIGSGRLAYDVSTGNIQYYSSLSSTLGWKVLAYSATGHHDDELYDSSATAHHHTLGTGAFQAAAGNHTHTDSTIRIPLPEISNTTNTVGPLPAANTYYDLGVSASITPGVVSSSYWVLVNYQAVINASTYPTTSDIFICLVGSGTDTISASTSSPIYTQRWRPGNAISTGVVNTVSGSVLVKLTPSSTTQTQTFTLKVNAESTTGSVTVVSSSLSVAPIGRYSAT